MTDKYNIIMVGTFDCENLGDLLFPISLHVYLSQRGILEQLYLFSPKECTMPFFPQWQVHCVDNMAKFLSEHKIDAIIIGGGDLIRLDDRIGKSYHSDRDSFSLWAVPIVLGKMAGISVVFNCPGVPFEFHNGNSKLVKFLLEQVDYLSVRDHYSKIFLQKCGITKPISVFPDTIVGIGQVYPPEKLDKIFDRLQTEMTLPHKPYIIFQINNSTFSEKHLFLLKQFILKIKSETEYEILFMPIGYEHDDDVALKKLMNICQCSIYFPDRKLFPEEMISLIAHGVLFIGTSLHGAVLSYVYHIKFMEIMTGFSTKIYGFCQKIHAEQNLINIDDDLWSRFRQVMEMDCQFLPLQNLLHEFDQHLSNIVQNIKLGIQDTDVKFLSDLFALSIDTAYQPIKPKVYFDYGEGYNEKDTACGDEVSLSGEFYLKCYFTRECKTVRFDPVEQQASLLNLEYAVTDKGSLNVSYTNGLQKGNNFIFIEEDPVITFNLPEKVNWIVLKGCIFTAQKGDCRHQLIENLYYDLKDSELKVMSEELAKIASQLVSLENNNTQLRETIAQLREENTADKKLAEEKNVQLNIALDKQEQLQRINSALQTRVDEILASTCWKLTSPLRGVVILSRKLFSPKTYGGMLKKIYMAFPISISAKLRIKGDLFTVFAPFIKNTNAYKAWKNYTLGEDGTQENLQQQKASPDFENMDYVTQIMNIPYEGNSEEYVSRSTASLKRSDEDVQYIAFYLPQFHPFPENDEWWGKGFTEWTNVTKAVPQFVGHNQPRLAGELGYYDLRNKNIIMQQIELAKLYGVFGFCIYLYWFDGKKLMDTPLRLIMENPELDFPFCLCWANENWSRRWDGKDQDILIAQNYDEHFPLKFIQDVAPYMMDPRYIRVDRKPVFLIYNANEIPHLAECIRTWREYCRQIDIGEIHLLAVDFSLNSTSRKAGFDGFVEFPPHSVYYYGMETINAQLAMINKNYAGRIFDYGQIVREKKYLKRDINGFYKAIFLGWDNTARKPLGATVFHRFTMSAFKEWLSDITKLTIQTRKIGDRLIFINAWNEWAEGTYLEPDRKYGYAALNVLKEVLEENSIKTKHIIYVSHDACYNGAQLLSLNIIEQLKKTFHYNVYVVLGKGGVLLPKFKELAKDTICLEQEENQEKTLQKWLRNVPCKKALCNTVVTGNILKQLSDYGIQCISMIHEMENVIKQYHCEEKLALIAKQAEKIVFASEYVRKSAEKICPFPADKIVIAPQGNYKVNFYGTHNIENRNAIREKFGLNSDTKIVLGVGFGDYRKGIDLFARTALEVTSAMDKVVFLWCGEVEPECFQKIQKMLKENPNQNQIIFAGPSDDVFQYYSASDLFVLTSREDPFPTVVMEAMSAGLPVIAFQDGGGYVEIVTESTGMLVPMEDWKSMAVSIISVLKDEVMYQKLSNNSVQYVSEHFNFIEYIYKLLELLEENYAKVSVVIPNYNYSRYLEQRINSVLQQDYPIFEIILLDDKSSDNSLDIMYQYEKYNPLQIKVHSNAVNSGNVFHQWEKGCQLAKGDFVWIAEADDLSDPGFLSSIINKMSGDEEIVLGYSQSYMMDENGKVTSNNYYCYTDDVDNTIWRNDYISDAQEEIYKRLATKNTIPNVSAVVFRRRDFSMMFREAVKYKVAGDWAFYVKLLEQGGKVAFVSKSLNYHRRHTDSVTKDTKAQVHFDEICKMQDYVCQKYADLVDLDNVMEYRKNVKKQLGLI